MIFRNATRVIVVLAATAAFAQNTSPGTTAGAPILSQRQAPLGRRGPIGNKNADPQGLIALRARVEDIEKTVSQMHAVLKRMSSKSKTSDSITKANLEMWQLMVGHLDKELEQMRVAVAAREDMEVRRAALYKQADAKAEAAAQAVRAAQAARFADADKNASGTPTPAATGQAPQPSPAAQTAPTPSSAVPQTNNPPSPN